jgi:hypothetical protein
MVLPPAGKLAFDMASICQGHEAGILTHRQRHHGARWDDFVSDVSSVTSP